MLQFGSSFVIGFKNLGYVQKKELIEAVEDQLGLGLTSAFTDPFDERPWNKLPKYQIGVGYSGPSLEDGHDFLQVDTGPGEQPIDQSVKITLENILKKLKLTYTDKPDSGYDKDQVFFHQYETFASKIQPGEIFVHNKSDYDPLYAAYGGKGKLNYFSKKTGKYIDIPDA